MEVLNVLIVPAIVKLFDMFNKKEWGGITKVFLAIAAGIGYYFVTGHFVFTDKVLYEGIAFGLQAAGLVTVAAKAGATK
jgi:hypothetical protein|nr:MAG TPA: hypothetical protein [Caudoviricetes sp.]